MGESGEQVGVDLGQPLELVGVGSEQRAAQAGVFVLAGCGLGASADPSSTLRFSKWARNSSHSSLVTLAVFLAGSQGSAAGDERPVVFDHVAVVDGDITLGGVDPPEVMRREPGRCPIPRG